MGRSPTPSLRISRANSETVLPWSSAYLRIVNMVRMKPVYYEQFRPEEGCPLGAIPSHHSSAQHTFTESEVGGGQQLLYRIKELPPRTAFA